MDRTRPTTPDVSEEFLRELLTNKRRLWPWQLYWLCRTIKPVIRENGVPYYIEPVNPRKVSFLWDPQITEEATGIHELSTIYTLHTYGYYGLFKPSVEEVLSMVPKHLIGQVRAFETFGPEDRDDLGRQWVATKDGYHVAVTILYA